MSDPEFKKDFSSSTTNIFGLVGTFETGTSPGVNVWSISDKAYNLYNSGKTVAEVFKGFQAQGAALGQ